MSQQSSDQTNSVDTVHPDIALLRDGAFRDVKGLPDDLENGTNKFGNNIIMKDSNGNVIGIRLYNMELSGSVHLTKLPPKLKELWLGSNRLSGHLDLTQLPSSLKTLALDKNSFTTIKIDNVPKCLKCLDVETNKLRGVILEPASVEYFDARDNEDLIVCKTQEEYDRIIAEMTRCVKMLRAARTSTHNAHEAFKVWDVAQQTINFLVNDVSLE